jgi:transcriptional regulator with XRE-family HTH domain
VVDDALMTPIQALISQVQKATGWSFRDISANAGDRPTGGPRLPVSTVQKIARNPLQRSPNLKTVEALAAGLRVPVGVVTAAIGETLGFREAAPGGRGFSLAHALAERIDTLVDDAERGHILGTVERLVTAAEAKATSRDLEQQTVNVEESAAEFGETAARLLDLVEESTDPEIAGMLDALRKLRDLAERESRDLASNGDGAVNDSNGSTAD